MTKHITQEEFDAHDCHAGPDSGCQVCAEWYYQQKQERRAVDEAMMKFQLGAI
jgi:hypothetical protein